MHRRIEQGCEKRVRAIHHVEVQNRSDLYIVTQTVVLVAMSEHRLGQEQG